ncbi:Glycoside Hydrolase Family 13 / Carbohydrate-Binding Module Family 20 protein [Trametes cinnabarina]|uniref:Alpha-amylase n=1 Tax=Pycnoporus cinnabarinus TaxID=5643 RepID=A0A060S3R1_PYCCI|nr:Glycoside Hydrolase Family 13 / Carbohydrate-Binding Module Family 20 protein [Trametes cinnabarina]
MVLWGLLRGFTVLCAIFSTAYARPSDYISSRSPLDSRAPFGNKDVIVQMFEWTWDSVAAECTDFLGPAGYGFVQGMFSTANMSHHRAIILTTYLVTSTVSPPQEHIQGDQWWTDYQPVSYTLTSKRGDRTQFANMISACHAAGVGVIADTIFNHMSGIDSGTGVAGSSFTHYNYPGIYQNQDFHHCGLEPGDDIVNYDNAVEVQTCELDNLADLATETEYVRGRLAEYANDLLSLGVDGLRLDAAKHINVTDIANILSRLDKSVYITQEVIFGEGEPITPNQYTGNGDVQEFRYTTALKNAFLGGGISSLQSFDNLGWVPGTGANVFVTNHDTERVSGWPPTPCQRLTATFRSLPQNGNSLNDNSPSNTYVTAMIFSLAHPYGTPTILSSYSGFTNTDAGAPNGGAGTCSGSGGDNGWLCQHRWTAVAGMVGFRNNVGGASLTNWVAPQSQQIAFGRGSAGFVAINNADADWSTTFETSLPDGSYCDVVSGASSNGSCTGSSFDVSSGSLTATVPARSAIAVHTGAKGSGNGSGTSSGGVTVNFAETATTTFGENIFVVGSIPQLGNWNPASAIALSAASYPMWTVSISIPADTTFEYKFIRKETDGSVVWESDPNREDTTPSSGSQTINTSWR